MLPSQKPKRVRRSAAEIAHEKAEREAKKQERESKKQEKEAKKYATWARQGWICKSWQNQLIILLETGELAKRVRSANAAYGFGKGAEEALTREQAMTLKVFTNDVLDDFFLNKTTT